MTDIGQLIPGIWTSTSHLLVFSLSGVEEAACVLHKSSSRSYYAATTSDLKCLAVVLQIWTMDTVSELCAVCKEN